MDVIEEGQLLERLSKSSARARGKGQEDRFVVHLLKKYASGMSPTQAEGDQTRAAARAISDDAPKNLDVQTRARMEALTGADLGDVRIHTGPIAEEIAEGAGARAFALNDSDIFFGRDEFSTTSRGGKALLAHELSHVADNRQGAFPSMKRPMVENESEARAERAEAMSLALEESSVAEVEKVVHLERIEEVEEEGMSLEEKKRWLLDQAWKRFLVQEKRQSDRLGLW